MWIFPAWEEYKPEAEDKPLKTPEHKSFLSYIPSGVRLGNCMEKYEKSLFFT